MSETVLLALIVGAVYVGQMLADATVLAIKEAWRRHRWRNHCCAHGAFGEMLCDHDGMGLGEDPRRLRAS